MSQFPPPPQAPNYPQPGAPMPQPRTSGLAIASLVLGLLGFCIPVVTSLVAIILGFASFGGMRKPGVSGKGLAIAGILLGFLGILGWGGFGASMGWLYLETKPARQISKQFITDLSNGKVDDAAAKCVPEMPRKTLEDHATLMKGWGTLTDTTFVSANVNKNAGSATEVMVAGAAVFGGGTTKSVQIQLVKQGDTYKIKTFNMQ